MQLTKQTDYSLRVLMYLGVRTEKLCTIKEICAAYRLSTGHVMKIVHELGKAGYIETIRGRNGGMRLAKEPAGIKLGEFVRFSEHNVILVECFRAEGNACALTSICMLSPVLQRALDSFFAVLDEYTLQDLIAKPAQLRAALDLQPGSAA